MSEASRFFFALGDETRLSIVRLLHDGEKSVGELVDRIGCPQPKISRHLKVLKDVGLARDRRDGRHVYYELAAPSAWGREARRWIEMLDVGLAGTSPFGSVDARPPAPALERADTRRTPENQSVSRERSSPRGGAEPVGRRKGEDMETFLL